MRPSPALRVLLAVPLATASLAACSGDDPTTPTALPPEASSTSAPPSASPGPTATAPEIEGLEVLDEDPSHDHVTGPVEYERVPPLGGPHNARWLACDVYDEPVPDELAVHSIEHGAVWLAHAPDLPPEQRAALAALARSNPEYVLVSPTSGLDSRVVAVTWGAAIEASSAEDPRLAQFVEAYAGGGQGGEPGAPCRTEGLTLEQARAEVAR